MRKLSAAGCAQVWSALCLAAMLVQSQAAHGDATARDGRGIDIRVLHADWGHARAGDIRAVLQSVAGVLQPDFPRRGFTRIEVDRGWNGPQVSAPRAPEGAYRVLLDVSDTRWDQFSYQFAHELCHVFTNFERGDAGPAMPAHSQHWFEEALCESVSVLALERVARQWEEAPPYPQWSAYAQNFRQYAQRLRSEPHRSLPAQESFADWYDANREALETNPYQRQNNELVANALLPLLERTPRALEATGYLNLGGAGADSGLRDYLQRWAQGCPDDTGQFVARVMALFEGNDVRGNVVWAAPPPEQGLDRSAVD